MQKRTGNIAGPFDITEDLELNGLVTGDATVRSGASFVLNGSVTGDLTVEDGGAARINGAVSGDVHNQGRVDLFGMIMGQLHEDGGHTKIAKGAIVNGHQH